MLAGGSARLSRLLSLFPALLVVVGLVAWTPDSAFAAVCDDFSNQREAQEAANTRDADGDGIYCEALPCPCLRPGESTGGEDDRTKPQPPPPPPKLQAAAAKQAAWSKVRRFVKRNPNVSGVSLNGCARRSKYKINCRFAASGKVGSRVTKCNLGVAVRGEGGIASATLRPVCRSHLELSADRAMAAMRAKAKEIAGKPAALSGFGRHSRAIFVGTAEWTRAEPALEGCTVDLIARLSEGDRVNVIARELVCAPVVP